MRSFFVFSFLFSVNAEIGRFNEHRELSPKDVGAYHTDAFEKLGALYKEKLPKSKLDAIADISNIMSSYCAVDDHECKVYAYKTALEHFHSRPKNGLPKVSYPDDFDLKAKASIEHIISIIEGIRENKVEDVISSLKDVMNELENAEDSNGHVSGAIAVASVAIESTKLWNSVFNDPNHGLHDIVMRGGNRRLQWFSVYSQVEVITADIAGAVAGLINTSPMFFFRPGKLPKVLANMILSSISYSATEGLDELEIPQLPIPQDGHDEFPLAPPGSEPFPPKLPSPNP